MKQFILMWLLCLLFFFLGILSATWKYHNTYKAVVELCAPYDCATDSECEAEKQLRWDRFI